jgi:hypothetical protein
MAPKPRNADPRPRRARPGPAALAGFGSKFARRAWPEMDSAMAGLRAAMCEYAAARMLDWVVQKRWRHAQRLKFKQVLLDMGFPRKGARRRAQELAWTYHELVHRARTLGIIEWALAARELAAVEERLRAKGWL